MTIDEIKKYFFGIFTGRIGVKNWILGILFLNIIGFFLGLFIVFFAVVFSDAKILSFLVAIALISFSIPFSIICLSLSVRRLHDKGKSGWFAFLFFVPIVNFFLSVYLLTKGEKEANEYGSPVPKDVAFFEDIFRLSKLFKKPK